MCVSMCNQPWFWGSHTGLMIISHYPPWRNSEHLIGHPPDWSVHPCALSLGSQQCSVHCQGHAREPATPQGNRFHTHPALSRHTVHYRPGFVLYNSWSSPPDSPEWWIPGPGEGMEGGGEISWGNGNSGWAYETQWHSCNSLCVIGK